MTRNWKSKEWRTLNQVAQFLADCDLKRVNTPKAVVTFDLMILVYVRTYFLYKRLSKSFLLQYSLNFASSYQRLDNMDSLKAVLCLYGEL